MQIKLSDLEPGQEDKSSDFPLKLSDLEPGQEDKSSDFPPKLADEDVRTQKLLNDQLEQDIKERERYAKNIFALISIWLIGLGLVIVLQGNENNGFNLSETLMLSLVGGTTINVLGLFFVVLKYLFPEPDWKNIRGN